MLLKKANTITTPTAYSNGFLHSVKPVEYLGSELVTNGTFDTDISGWIQYLSVSTWDNGTIKSTSSGTTIAIRQNGILSDNTTYKLTFDAKASTLNQFSVYTGVDWQNIEPVLSETDTWQHYEVTFTFVTGGTHLIIRQTNTVLNDTANFDNVSLKEIINADFTFTRNSSATRVNELGYIEDVQIIGGELVSNGDFEEIGSELVTNGDFSDGSTGWTSVGLVTIADGVASFVDNGTNTNSYIEQNVLTASKTYKVLIEVTRYVAGKLQIIAGTTTFNVNISGIGLYEIYVQPTSTSLFRIKRWGAYPNFDFDIDNVSVKEVGQNWSFSNIDFSLGQVDFDTFTDNAVQIKSFTSGNKYRFTFSGSGFLRYRTGFAGTDGTLKTIPYLPYSVDIVATSDTNRVQIYGSAAGSGTLTNISVKEVTDDTNLPRINYEGFTYENGLPVPYSGKGHLLLEGQRTNELTYSEDFSQWILQDGASVTSNVVFSPSGNLDAYLIDLSSTTDSRMVNNIGVTSTQYTLSFYLKKHQNDSNGTFPLAYYDGSNYIKTYVDLTDQWQRFSITFNTASGIIGYGLSRKGTTSDETLTRCYAWGAQLEQGSYSTSYIPTLNGTAVTRLGETCNNATHSFPSEGVLYAEANPYFPEGNRQISISDGSTSNRVVVEFRNNGTELRGYIVQGGSVYTSLVGTTPTLNQNYKIAIRYKNNDASLWVDGVQVDTDASLTTPTNLNQLAFDAGGGVLPFYGKTKMVATFPYLSNDEMECLTGEGYGTFEALAAAYSYTIK